MTKTTGQARDIRVAYIGGGSRYWAPKLFTDMALTPEISGEILLYDIDHAKSLANVRRARHIFGHPDARTSFKVRAVRTLPAALKGADFVILSILPGPVQVFANDLDIPARYGVIQTVGDTTGPGGISRSLRSVPIYLGFAGQIMEHCPRAWVINYTNPMTLCTAALYAAAPEIRALGCCHEVFGSQGFLASIFSKVTGRPQPHHKQIKVDVAGVNHFTFFTAARYEGEDLFPAVRRHIRRKGVFDDHTARALEYQAVGRFGSSFGLVQLDFFRRFGAFGAAGDRHLVEFVPWYLGSLETLHRWGVSVTPSAARLKLWKPAPDRLADVAARKTKPAAGLTRSKEEGVDIMLALLGLRDLDSNANLPNRGQLPDLPAGAVVETNAQFRRDAINPIVSRPLPAGLNALVRRVVEVQQLTLQAAIARDAGLALQAMLNDPLVTISPDRAWAMLKELLRANGEMLPGWKV